MKLPLRLGMVVIPILCAAAFVVLAAADYFLKHHSIAPLSVLLPTFVAGWIFWQVFGIVALWQARKLKSRRAIPPT